MPGRFNIKIDHLRGLNGELFFLHTHFSAKFGHVICLSIAVEQLQKHVKEKYQQK
jgi:hypothetical protein